jgi:nuclear GTP-binding protein
MGKATLQVKGNGKAVFEDVDVETEENMPPILINHDLPNLRSVLDQADVIIQVLDARDPLAFRSLHLEELAGTKPGRRMLFILNKIGSFIVRSYSRWPDTSE